MFGFSSPTISVTILLLYIKTCQGKGGCHDDWNPEVNECTSGKILDEQGYEGTPCKANRTEDTVRKCPCGKIQHDRNFSEHALICMVERKCQEGENGYGVIHCEVNGKDDTVSKCLPDKLYASIRDKDRTKGGDHFEIAWDGYTHPVGVSGIFGMQQHQINGVGSFCMFLARCLDIFGMQLHITDGVGSASRFPFESSGSFGIKQEAIAGSFIDSTTFSVANGLSSRTTLIASSLKTHFTSSTPTNIPESSPPNEKLSSIGSQIYLSIFSAAICIAAIITGVCAECYARRRWNNGTEDEHEPLYNHNGGTYIPMADLNINQTHAPGELQAKDSGDQNGNTDTNCGSLEGQLESENKDITGSQSNDSFHTAGTFCRCCNRYWNRCNKLKQNMARVKPQQGFNEMPPTETVEVEVFEYGYVNASFSIPHHSESHGSTNTVDEDTTHVKSAYSNEQVSSTVEQTNEADGICYEESEEAELHNEDHMITGIPSEGDLLRSDPRLGRTNHDEEQIIAENVGDVNDLLDTEAA